MPVDEDIWTRIDHHVAQTMAQGKVVRRWTEGRGSLCTRVVLLTGPWPGRLRVVVDFGGTATAHACDESVEETMDRLLHIGALFNATACLDHALGSKR